MPKRSQTGEKPYGCTQCESTFPHSSTLKTILKTQWRGALLKYTLKMHIEMHIDEKLDKVIIVLLISDVWRSFEIQLRIHITEKSIK